MASRILYKSGGVMRRRRGRHLRDSLFSKPAEIAYLRRGGVLCKRTDIRLCERPVKDGLAGNLIGSDIRAAVPRLTVYVHAVSFYTPLRAIA